MPDTDLDRSRRYLRPVARLELPGEPDLVHLSLYEWLPKFEEWATGLALCGRSAEQGALPDGTEVTCPDCLHYRPRYQAVLERQAAAAQARRKQTHALDTPENGAWLTVWLEGEWRWITSRMTTAQREYAADCVARYDRYLAECDGDLERGEPEGLRWWREDAHGGSGSTPYGRRYRLTREHLTSVAATYRAAVAEGAGPTRAVANHFGVPHSTAAKWVGHARKQRILPPVGDEGEQR